MVPSPSAALVLFLLSILLSLCTTQGMAEVLVAKPTELAQCKEKNEALEAQVAHLSSHVEYGLRLAQAMSQTHAENLGGVHSELNQKIITLAELQRSMEDLERRVEMCESASGGGRRLTEINLDDAFGRMFGSVASTRFITTARNITSPIISAASGLVWGPASDPVTYPVEGDSHVDLLFYNLQGYLDEHISGTRLVLPSGLCSRLLLVVFVLLFSYVLTVTLLMLVLAPLKLGGLLFKQ